MYLNAQLNFLKIFAVLMSKEGERTWYMNKIILHPLLQNTLHEKGGKL
jgi:hypothetical protein